METTLTSNKSLLAWLDEKVELTKPSKIVWIDGSKEQIDALKAEAVETGEMIKLNEELLPDCYLHRTAENDVARVEDRTLICSKKKRTPAPPTTGWSPLRLIKCSMTSLPVLTRAEPCISFPIPWVPLVLPSPRSVSRSPILSTLC